MLGTLTLHVNRSSVAIKSCVLKTCSLRAICTFSSLYSQYLLNTGVVMGLLVCCWSLHVCCGGMCSRLYWDGEAVFTSPHMVL